MTSPGCVGGSPCGACKFLRRKCAPDCIFAPHFWSDQGPDRFAAIHKVFGASNVSKLLSFVPDADRSEAVLTVAYEAQARLRDPVYGCVSHIFSLQQQVACLEAQVLQAKAELARSNLTAPRQWPSREDMMTMMSDGQVVPPSSSSSFPISAGNNYMMSSGSSQSSYESTDRNSSSSADHAGDGYMNNMQDYFNYHSRSEGYNYNTATKKRIVSSDLGELQALALRMMRN